MNENFVIERLIPKIREYAKGRLSDVERGAETPHLSSLLLQIYGFGIIEAVIMFTDSQRSADALYKVLEEEASKIDPQWSEHSKERWLGRPSDIITYNPTENNNTK